MTLFSYPKAPRVNLVETLHGRQVADPFRPLENPHADETKQWVHQQNELTESFLAKSPAREKIRSRLKELWNFPRHSAPTERKGRLFYTRNDGLQNQDVWYWKDGWAGTEHSFLDLNNLRASGTAAVNYSSPSPDGRLFAYALSDGGSDWSVVHIRDVEANKDLQDQLRWVKFSALTWDFECNGFFYCRFPEPDAKAELEGINLNAKIYYHRLATPQDADQLIMERPDDPSLVFTTALSDCGRYLVISANRGTETNNITYVKDLKSNQRPEPLIPKPIASYAFIGNDGREFYFTTNRGAPHYSVVAIDIDSGKSRTVVAESEDRLASACLIGETIYLHYMHHVCAKLKRYDLRERKSETIELPGKGCVNSFHNHRDADHLYFVYESITMPPTLYRYHVKTQKSECLLESSCAFDPGDYVTNQVFYAGKDGTRIPMFIAHRKDTDPTNDRPLLLYGYGGFDLPVLPWFMVSRLAWLELGGTYAIANIRGGGEYGAEWHRSGTKQNKQTVFDDFIAAAEYLIDQKYTSRSRLGIIGGSNGGLLVGACLTQRPDLFQVCIPQVGVLDMLRFHKFTIGWAWVSDFGDPENSSDFSYLLDYSPLHNLKSGGMYPAVLITTGDHDDRVVPAHSFKFAAALQQAQAGDNPVLIRVETEAGHGAGKPVVKVLDETADVLTFLHDQLSAG